ncbi:hypothetical protein YB2330_003849 [Saitoella coloradoensis]
MVSSTNFEEVVAVDAPHYGTKVTKYRSKVTGLSAVVVDLNVPVVHGYFAVATEIHNDSGCPHTLEHLIFLGSEKYPYKGVLDTLANRAFAQGTNAWTDTDNTVYTIETVGQDGFLRILPVFVDHVLYPTLTEAGCYTEVYHVNGEGEDAGVVYSEMQGRENTPGDLMDLASRRLLFPEGNGYRSETGGLMAALRQLSVQEIREYHASYYVPQNLSLIITGNVDHNALLETLQNTVEQTIIEKGVPDLSTWQRPWVDSPAPSPLGESKTATVEFPEEDESMGELMISWLGPSCNDNLTCTALNILGNYLTESVSVLEKEFVEIEDPLATDISFYTSDSTTSVISLYFSSVPTEALENVEKRLHELLHELAETGFDLERVHMFIERDRLKTLDACETSPHYAFSTPAIIDSIYGSPSGETLTDGMNDLKYYDVVRTWSSADWISLLKKWLIDNHHVSILGKPSAELVKKLETEEKARKNKRRQELGESGLKELEKKLNEAKETNEAEIPKGVIESFRIPNVEGIKFIEVDTARAGIADSKGFDNEVQKHVIADGSSDLPIWIQFDHIKSEFVTISLYFSTANIPARLRPYISIFLDSFFMNPLHLPDGTKLSFEEVVQTLDADTVEYGAWLGVRGGWNEIACVTMKVESRKYEKAIGWLRDLWTCAKMDEERIGIAVSKSQNDMPQQKRDGSKVSWAALQMLQMDAEKSTARAANILTQDKFLDALEEKMEEDEGLEAVLKDVEEMRTLLFRGENLRVHVVGDVLRLEKPSRAWVKFEIPSGSKEVLPVPLSRDNLTEQGKNPNGSATVVALPSIESSYSVHVTKSDMHFTHPNLAALQVLFTYLDTMEGILWKYIRGSGLAYGADLRIEPESGFLYFSIYRSPDASKAWSRAHEIVQEFKDGKIELTQTMLDSAKSSVVFNYVSGEGTPASKGAQSFVNQVLREESKDRAKEMLKKVQAVTLEDLRGPAMDYLIQLFDVKRSDTVAVSSPAKAKDLEQAFAKAGFNVAARTLDDFE